MSAGSHVTARLCPFRLTSPVGSALSRDRLAEHLTSFRLFLLNIPLDFLDYTRFLSICASILKAYVVYRIEKTLTDLGRQPLDVSQPARTGLDTQLAS